MSRIGAHLSGIERTLLNRLAEANAAATVNALRIATGQKINAPSDDPSAFVTLSRLQTRLTTVTAATANVKNLDGGSAMLFSALTTQTVSAKRLKHGLRPGSKNADGDTPEITNQPRSPYHHGRR